MDGLLKALPSVARPPIVHLHGTSQPMRQTTDNPVREVGTLITVVTTPTQSKEMTTLRLKI
jgi:hypothetical protein